MENEPIRVLHIVPNMQAGGLETLIMNIYRNIDRTKVQFDFLVHYTGNYFYDDEIRSLGGRIYKLSVRDDNNFIKYLKDLDAFFKKHPEYKIVHGHMESLGQFYFKAAKKNGVPVRVAHSHNSATENTIKGKIKGLLLKRYKVFATDYFACSQKAGEFMFANKKFTVLKNAIIVNNFIYNENERNRLRKELGIKGKIVIGHAGRFCEQKNHKFLIDKAALSGKYESDIQNIYFRSKVLGHHLSTIAVRFSNGKLIHSRRLVKSYPRLWFAGFASRPSCYACSFKEEDRVSDFTLFDSFKSAGQYGFKDDDMGLSNVYVRTQKAIDLWKQIETQVTAVKTETAVTNKNDGDMIYESAVKNKARAEFWSDYGKLSYTELIDKYIPYSKKEAIWGILLYRSSWRR